MTTFSFFEELAATQTTAAEAQIIEAIRTHFPGANIRRATEAEDRQGTDWWADHYRIDVKRRKNDCRHYGDDDVMLEAWSVVEKHVPGWTWDTRKKTDYVLWIWADTGRSLCLPANAVRLAYLLNRADWGVYPCKRQRTNFNGSAYHSECVFIPYNELLETVNEAQREIDADIGRVLGWVA